ncbi:NAD(P)-dependent dehydrogenase (short-subunit alcohol dehydrogenase family) [Paraburkholderia sp. UCT70]|uniref:SDR family NAD(P)-dependent oxidoreductase n=1 Tax=Paraburkholderia sp. UCT70 TaxID=2991068 RepID=UPI003D1E4AC9
MAVVDWGGAIALRFAAEGAKVIAVSVSDAGKDVAEVDSRVEFYRGDVSQPEAVQAMVEHCRARYGRLDVLVNNAGRADPNPLRIHEVPVESWDQTIAVNVRGAFLVLKYAIPLMLASGGGSIVNIASMGSFRGSPRSSAYITSNGAMLMLTRTAALEYVKDHIRVNALCPGVIETDMVRDAHPDVRELLQSRIPLGRMGTPEEVASFALFLGSDEASFVTGGAYVIDGGRSAT